MNDHQQAQLRSRRKRHLKRLAWIAICILLVLLFARLMTLQGWARSVRVVGGSMAGELRGAHYLVPCDDCGFSFRCGVEYAPEDRRAVCPNCGYNDNRLPAQITRGRRVLIDRWAGWFRGPHLWQTVALPAPSAKQQLVVKRIVAGGPGQIEIRHGDVFVDGMIQRKSVEQLRKIRILVHDDRYRPTRDASLPSRWVGAREKTRWQTSEGGYSYSKSSSTDHDSFDWLEYHQWTCWSGAGPSKPRTESTAISDHYGYNQNLSRGPLNVVTDVMLACELRWQGDGRCALRVAVDNDCFELIIDSGTREFQLLHHGERRSQGTLQIHAPAVQVEMALCDNRVLAAINGRSIVCHPYQLEAAESGARRQQIAVGAHGLNLRLIAPRIYRDIHYLGPGGIESWQSTKPLTGGQWFALGDNVPVSVDSRTWSAVHGPTLLGPVFTLGD